MFQADLIAQAGKVLHNGKYKDNHQIHVLYSLLHHAIPINIQPVSDYLYTGTEQEDWYLDKDFPNLAPPWEVYWASWQPSPWTRSNGQVIQREMLRSYEYGCLCLGLEVDKYRPRIDDDKRMTPPPEAKWVTVYYLFGRNKANGHTCYWSLTFCVDKDGVGLYEKGGISCGNPRNWPSGQEEVPIPGKLISPTSAFKDIKMTLEHEVVGSLFPLFLAISFCHCRNVEIKDIPTPPKVLQKRERKGIWSPKVRREIHIEPMKKVLRATPGTGLHDLKRQLVIRRGHFKDFKEGRGLFGKHHGLYWWDHWVKDSSNVRYQIESK